MRRSSRIQIKQENTSAPKCDPVSTDHKKIPLQSIENQPTSVATSSTRTRISRRRDLKKRSDPVELKRRTIRKSVEQKENSGAAGLKDVQILDREQIQAGNETGSSSVGCTLLTQEESNDSIFSDVANSIKIDRTIKNLSPKKFFLNKNGKTTRSGRSFSPYDFATYALLFGNLSAGSDAQKQLRDACPVRSGQNQGKRAHSRTSQNRRRNRENWEPKRSKKCKNRRKQYRRRDKVFIAPTEDLAETVRSRPLVAMKIEKPDFESEDLLYSEEVPAAFLFDFPPASDLEGHSLPRDFYRPYDPVAVSDAEAPTSVCSTPLRKLGQVELDALSKISLADADKYEFKSVFKDVQAQVANFENHSGHEVPGGDVHKFDLMESESVEGRRFYRKRITDTRLIAWHKYNLMSSTRYLSDADPPAHARPIIKVRSNQCQRADLVWRLNQTLPPPSIEDVLDLSKEESRKPLNPNPCSK
ncbi:hypothetical protein GE061_017330 [Apolygus lucorum]|uniref:Uncharacterized protein n=1 Tax=Apolygus lucorum TaxID=248454 RepID=A0A8S9XES5_APOLU|nr:hypothetical protein GE061_017330 [Apolygus lucorum]